MFSRLPFSFGRPWLKHAAQDKIVQKAAVQPPATAVLDQRSVPKAIARLAVMLRHNVDVGPDLVAARFQRY